MLLWKNSPPERVSAWIENVRKVKRAVNEGRIDTGAKNNESVALDLAVDAAKRLDIRVHSRRIDEVLDATLAVGFGALTSFVLTDWSGFSLQLLAGLKDIRSETARRKKKTEEILRVFDRDVREKEGTDQEVHRRTPAEAAAGRRCRASLYCLLGQRTRPEPQGTRDRGEYPAGKARTIDRRLSLYTQKLPHGQDIVDLLPEPPKILKRQGIIDRIQRAIESFVDIFEW